MNASLLKAEVTAAPGCRGTDDDVIDQVELKDFPGFENPAGEPQIGLGRRGIAHYAAPIRRNKPEPDARWPARPHASIVLLIHRIRTAL